MRVKHLKENDIQAYVEGSLDRLGQKGETHLSWCQDCSEAVDDYRAILSALKVDDVPKLKEGFSERVMLRLKEQLALAPAAKKWYSLSTETIIALAFGGLLGILMTFYYSGMGALGKIYQILTLQVTQVFQNVLGSISGVLAKSGLKPEILLFACMLLLLFGILDKQLSRAKRSRINLHTL